MRGGLVGLMVATVVLGGCFHITPMTAIRPDGVALLENARAAGLPSDDPLALDEGNKKILEDQVGRHGSSQERMDRLLRWIQRGTEGFQHDSALTVDARTAFTLRRGGCISHSLLLISAARFLGVDAFMLHSRSAPRYLERTNEFVALTHVAVGWEDANVVQLVDVWIPRDQWRLVEYERLDDRAAIALYYSNIAVKELRSGRPDEAESLLRFLARETPDVPEVRSNLVASLLRRGAYDDALVEAREGIARFPRFSAFYTNGYAAALGTGDRATARDFALRGDAAAQADPMFLYARGVHELLDGNGELATQTFETALAIEEDSVLFRAWLVRARLSTGDAKGAVTAFAEARKRAPDDARLRELAQRYPTLAAR